MSYPARWIQGVAVTGDFDSDAAGTVNPGETLSTANIALGTLSCLYTVDAETNTITLAAAWQVSNDGSTWYTLKPLNNAASTVLATGTAGADAAVSVVIEAPQAVLGWKQVRPAVISGVATGGATDTFSMTTCYRKFNGFS